ncbi:deoxyribonuclease V [Vibrio sp. S4M6]|uniref:deoxyribonuclease V n=1 Tax=Vibrio sinus TaxID=2946865 RepID=UPI00202A9C18|nr:deoxyribonuclease V [Vibrio sinus]MCL9783929.1 deoxyribonuclease V [Vibrio sinus]
MKAPTLSHSWNLSVDEATKLQDTLSQKVDMTNPVNQIDYVAGVDVTYDKRTDNIVSVAVVLCTKTLEMVEYQSFSGQATFPYIPGLFSFRELPILTKAIDKLKITPDLIICDAQGIAHPRGFGLACHLGLLYDIPTIGCAKNLLLGEFNEVGSHKGDAEYINHNGKVIGAALRTRSNVKPVYVSIGHKINLDSACQWVMKLTTKYRLPETTRLSDQISRSILNSSLPNAH